MRTVEDLAADIERRLAELAATGSDAMRVMDLPQTTADGRLLLGAAVDGSRLLVPFGQDRHRSFKPDRRSAGLQLSVTPLETDDGRRYYLDVLCPRPDLRWLFASFVADALLRLSRDTTVEGSVVIRRCVDAWRAMFAREGRRLSLKQLAGLFGELTILRRLQDRSPDAAARWKGPLQQPHDFVGVGAVLEVKSTLSTEDRIVHINGLAQLAAPGDSELVVAHLRLEPGASDGESVPSVVKAALRMDATGTLSALLQASGYFGEHAETYDAMRFRLVEEEWFRVDDAFPRLTAATFPHGHVPVGLDRFSYTLDLATVGSPSLPAGTLQRYLDRVAA